MTNTCQHTDTISSSATEGLLPALGDHSGEQCVAPGPGFNSRDGFIMGVALQTSETGDAPPPIPRLPSVGPSLFCCLRRRSGAFRGRQLD